MSSILTNPRVGHDMSELELRARRGDPWAQAELSKQCMQFANHMMLDTKLGADSIDRKEMLSK